MSKKEFDSDGSGSLLNQWRHAWQEKILNHAHIQYELKDKIYQLLVSGKSMSAVY